MSDFSFELSPMIMNRLSDESGWSITGVLATFGSAWAWVSRSATTWRALRTSVPGSKIIRIDERPAIDSDRISSRNATPCSRSASSGTVTSSSTSSAERPRASVWTSTEVGVNWGNTSTRALESWVAPTISRTPARPIANSRKRTLVLTMARIMSSSPTRSRVNGGTDWTPPLSDVDC